MFIIKENFYHDPDSMREYALSLEFSVQGNYPGFRTKPPEEIWWRDYIKQYLEEEILHKKIIRFPCDYNTSFQYTTKDAVTWVHHDDTTWAGIVYLTPNAPIESGTAIYQHKESKIFEYKAGDFDYNSTSTSMADWDMIAFSGNIYNRLVLYKGTYYHRSVLPGFGTDARTGRLFQTFFFDTEV